MGLTDTVRTMLSPRHSRPTAPMRAVWKGTALAESDDTVVIEGNHYFPMSSLKREHFQPSDKTSVCPWKGTANYYDIVVGDETNAAAAWTYPSPRPAAAKLEDRVAFWKGVDVQPVR